MPQQPCLHCGKAIDANARFCPHCGKPTALYGGPCPYCGRPISANARFCPHCSRQMGGQRGPEVQGGAWRKSPDEFAVRVEPADLQGVLKKEVEVQPGQEALLMVDGNADVAPMGPGRYTLETLFDKVFHLVGGGRHLTALVVDASYTQLEFRLPQIYTRDNHAVAVRCVIGVKVGVRPDGAGGEITDRVCIAGANPYACVLGGAERRDLYVCCAPHHDPAYTLAQRGGRIDVTCVAVPGAGWP